MEYIITTIASHSSLQILKGASDEGFETLAIATAGTSSFYRRFPFIKHIIEIPSFDKFDLLEKGLEIEKLEIRKLIIIPHGSFVAYIPKDSRLVPKLKYYGSKSILEIESDRMKQHNWMVKSGLTVPKIFGRPESVDRPVIVKFHGAKGGQGYFIAADKKDLKKKLSLDSTTSKESHSTPPRQARDRSGPPSRRLRPFVIQEYIIGTPVYFQYFYSLIKNEIELMGIDRRYETDADGIGRIPAKIQNELEVNPTFTVIGNIPLVVRESMLPKVYEMGENVVKTVKKISETAELHGPFCLETVITPDQKIYCIEISTRIVAGTNLYVGGSPYTNLVYNEPMSTGRRIAREIKETIERDKLEEILG